MKRLFFTLFVMCLTIMAHAQATSLTVDCQNPGWLSSKIAYGDQQTVRNLTVTGYINNDDVTFIASLRNEHKLKQLDLENANIVTSGKEDLLNMENLCYRGYEHRWTYISFPQTLKRPISDRYTSEYKGNFYTDSLIMNLDKQQFFPEFEGRKGYSTSFSYLELGDHCDSIPDWAFDGSGQIQPDGSVNSKMGEVIINSTGLKYVGNRLRYKSDKDSTKFQFDNFSKLELLGYNALYTNDLPDTIYLPNIRTFCENAFRYRKRQVIYLGNKIKTIGNYASVYYENGKSVPLNGAKIHIQALNPPMLYNHSSELNEMKGDTIYVPTGCLSTYLANDDWKECVDKGYIVLLEEPKKLESIELDQHELVLDAGESTSLKATLEPKDAENVNIQWTSSDVSIATVSDKGMVKAIKSGETMVYATDAQTGIKDSCKVVVKTHVSSIEVKPSSITFDQIGQTKQLEVVFTPDNSYDKNVTWQTGNTNICFVSNSGFVTAVGSGTTVVVATTVDGGISASCVVTVNTATGIDEINAFPDTENVEIYSVDGQRLSKPVKGINIIKQKGQPTKKLLVK